MRKRMVVDEEVAKLYKAYGSMSKVALELNVCTTTVRNSLLRSKTQRKSRGDRTGIETRKVDVELLMRDKEQMGSIVYAAQAQKVSVTTAWRRLRKYGNMKNL